MFSSLYKIHLLITYFFTFKWMSFGNFSTFHSNISKSELVIKEMIMADEEQIIYFFGIQSICEYLLKRLRKLNI